MLLHALVLVTRAIPRYAAGKTIPLLKVKRSADRDQASTLVSKNGKAAVQVSTAHCTP